MGEEYFVVRPSGEGYLCVYGPFTKSQLLEKITPDKFGHTYYGSDLNFVNRIPDEDRTDEIAVIRGSIIVPKVVEVTTKFEL